MFIFDGNRKLEIKSRKAGQRKRRRME